MLRKVWHKPAHTRKYWKKKCLISKIVYYMKPFAREIIETLQQPVPFPTVLKLSYIIVLLHLFLLPIIYPLVILLWTFIDLQILVQSHYAIEYPSQFDLADYFWRVIFFEAPCQAQQMFMNLYFQRIKLTGMTIITCIDYCRLVFISVTGAEL